MKYLLHIDTSGDSGCVALAGDGKLLAHQINTEARNHAGSINIMIQDIIGEVGISIKDLSGIVVCAGPGSYTGLRIGLSTAKGLCYAADLPLLMDNKLTLLANQAYAREGKTYKYYAALLTAREKEYFISVFDNEFNNIFPAQHIQENELRTIVLDHKKIHMSVDASFVANSLEIGENLNISTMSEIDLNLWVSYAFEQYQCNKTVNLSTAEPFYLKQVYTHK